MNNKEIVFEKLTVDEETVEKLTFDEESKVSGGALLPTPVYLCV